MISPLVFAECELGLPSINRAEAARGRLIPVAIIAPPIRALRRDISVLLFVVAAETYTFSIGSI